MAAKYDQIGKDYNSTRTADPYLTQQLITHLQPVADGLYLDIGCGTGNYTCQMAMRGISFIGVDPSATMLEKASAQSTEISWKLGEAEALPVAEEAVDGAIGSLTIHHWGDLHSGFSEVYRVLKPGGRFVIFTATPEQLKGYWLNHYFPKMLEDSIVQMPAFDQIRNAMKQSRLEVLETDQYFIQPDLQDKFLYSGKHDPALYLNEQIRKGISSFAALSNQAEVEKGLTQLRSDIESGSIQQVIDDYTNELGDYLFIIAGKPASD